MNKIWIAIEAGGSAIAGALANAALRKAATERGWDCDIEIRNAAGMQQAYAGAAPKPGDVLLLIGGAQPASPQAGLARSAAGLDEALAAPDRVIAAAIAQGKAPDAGAKRIVAVTSCPTGIAHTFMAAEGLTQAAQALGHHIRVETQGSVGSGTPLTAEEIAAADLVIIAADREVDRSRFGGKRVHASNTKPAISDGQALIARAFEQASLQAASSDAASTAQAQPRRAGPYKHLMTGVSFMLPFVVAGGLLIALAFALGGIYASDESQAGTLAHALFQIGAQGGFALIVPALAGYIAYSIADRPGIAPGMIGGLLAANMGTGFLGGIVAGFIAGYGTDFMNRRIPLPKQLQGLKPVLILPLLGTLLTGLLITQVVGAPVAAAQTFLTDWLRGMQGASAVMLGMLLGGMMAFDMGGPVNKAAYAFSTSLIASHVYTPMAATMAAGMTPPLAIALATRLFANRYTAEEREAGGATGILGLAFITEGAIPFVARDPLRMIPSLMAGSAVTGAISMAIGAELKVPHGGIFVLPIPGAVTHLLGYVAALVAGTLVSTLAIGLLKRPLAAAQTKNPES
ncbi:fructose-specific PTS transporter subunit EIIC [Achromobacter sp. Marseille-Q0513]|uniref:PTS fructose transporter subunit IIC n=1 Tax=Achromobacter sp. Marseille-Q0513 TaxID=2829161 RepID=UPI001BA026B7|nr:fructose-specific PTS transporter subunit EIIC [Achromobacter sp. Marseille-Q0513]MBR8652105.1 fructose-specific PTS transporter subunit EIIC [Achromobacter sp. Marseille-Q0513]